MSVEAPRTKCTSCDVLYSTSPSEVQTSGVQIEECDMVLSCTSAVKYVKQVNNYSQSLPVTFRTPPNGKGWRTFDRECLGRAGDKGWMRQGFRKDAPYCSFILT